MKAKFLSKEWERLIGEDASRIEIKRGNTDWLLELLGWKKDARRSK